MKKIIFLLFTILFSFDIKAQANFNQNGFGVNLTRFGYQTFGIDYIRKSNFNQHQFLLGIGIVHGDHNVNQKRYQLDFDGRFMQNIHDKSKGYWIDIQWRKKLSKLTNDKLNLYGVVSYTQQNMTMTFSENMYDYQPPFYYYTLKTFSEKLNRNTVGLNLLFHCTRKLFFIDFELGLGYNHIKMGENLAKYRNYQMNKFDYAYKGLVPLLGFRLGAFLF